jgi:hypothetical protein
VTFSAGLLTASLHCQPLTRPFSLLCCAGLLVFLDHDPFADQASLSRGVVQPFHEGQLAPMRGLLPKFLWRHSKADVKDELVIPRQADITLAIELGAEDRAAYRDAWARGSRQITKHMRDLVRKQRVWHEDPHTAGRVYQGPKGISQSGVMMSVLLALRQSCCHSLVAKDAGTVLGGQLLSAEHIAQQLVGQAEAAVERAKDQQEQASAEAALSHVLGRVEALKVIASPVGGEADAGAGEESETCTVCLEPFEWPVVTGCCHIFCRECVHEVIASKRAGGGLCPICRSIIRPKHLMEVWRTKPSP